MVHNGILLSHKKECIESVLMRWMKLEPIIQSEVSQKKKDKHRILTCMYGIQKMVLKNLFTGQQWRRRHREQTKDMERGKEKVICMEKVI